MTSSSFCILVLSAFWFFPLSSFNLDSFGLQWLQNLFFSSFHSLILSSFFVFVFFFSLFFSSISLLDEPVVTKCWHLFCKYDLFVSFFLLFLFSSSFFFFFLFFLLLSSSRSSFFTRGCLSTSLQSKELCPICKEKTTMRSTTSNPMIKTLVDATKALVSAYEKDTGHRIHSPLFSLTSFFVLFKTSLFLFSYFFFFFFFFFFFLCFAQCSLLKNPPAANSAAIRATISPNSIPIHKRKPRQNHARNPTQLTQNQQ